MSQISTPFEHLNIQKPDPILALIAEHDTDQRLDKIDVGIGVYRDDYGETPVMRAVKAAEALLVEDQPTKAYLGMDGDVQFTALLERIVFGSNFAKTIRVGIQTPGGTGALRLGAELIARNGADTRVWLGTPTWPNHVPIFNEAGIETVIHPYHDSTTGIAFDAMVDALGSAAPGDVVLLHGCCHNPTGTQFSSDQWQALTDLCNTRGLVPFIDLAYQGLGNGLEDDANGARQLFDAVPSALLAYSCDKNFGLYRERVGALWVRAATPSLTELVRTNLLNLARCLWSMPPDHGAAVVRTILDDPRLTRMWLDELDTMRVRINSVRSEIAGRHPALTSVASQRGLFSLLPINSEAVSLMRSSHGIYMPPNARVNFAGLNTRNLDAFIDAVAPYLQNVGSTEMVSSAGEKGMRT